MHSTLRKRFVIIRRNLEYTGLWCHTYTESMSFHVYKAVRKHYFTPMMRVDLTIGNFFWKRG